MPASGLLVPKLALSRFMSLRSFTVPPDAVKFMIAPASEMPVHTTAPYMPMPAIGAAEAGAEQDAQDHEDRREAAAPRKISGHGCGGRKLAELR